MKNIKVHSLPRTGSTLFMRLLDQHPKIISSSELTFVHKQDIDRYANMHGSNHVASKVIYMPTAFDYLYDVYDDHERSICLLRKDIVAQMSSIYILRTDVDVQPLMIDGAQVLRSLEAGRKKAGGKTPVEIARRGIGALDQQILSYMNIKRYLKNPTRETMVVYYEDLISDTNGALNKVFEFFGLEKISIDTGRLAPSKLFKITGDPRAKQSIKVGQPREVLDKIKELVEMTIDNYELQDFLPESFEILNKKETNNKDRLDLSFEIITANENRVF